MSLVICLLKIYKFKFCPCMLNPPIHMSYFSDLCGPNTDNCLQYVFKPRHFGGEFFYLNGCS